jgi:ubiquinone/menaquinone biosynthesis C-methylase UbiE
MNYMKNPEFVKKASLGIGLVRSLNYTAQGVLLPLIDKLIGNNRPHPLKEFSQNLKLALPKVKALIEKDSNHIANGDYPLSVLFEETPVTHYARLPSLIQDAVRAHQQRTDNNAKQFANTDPSFLENIPDYYRRNFHFQDGGYLSDKSARLYDHQVEILFSGTAQVMRRQIIPSMKNHFSKSDGKGLKILEIGSGTGSLTKALALAFPNAQITSLDPSPHYLQYAKNRLGNFKRIDFLQGYGEDLNFKNESFDAVISCYLFHELPLEIRKKVIKESYRVLKAGGYFGLADSIQTGDDPEMDWALKKFPIDFHEPFYKNYVETNMQNLVQSVFKAVPNSEVHFLTKTIWIQKSEKAT